MVRRKFLRIRTYWSVSASSRFCARCYAYSNGRIRRSRIVAACKSRIALMLTPIRDPHRILWLIQGCSLDLSAPCVPRSYATRNRCNRILAIGQCRSNRLHSYVKCNERATIVACDTFPHVRPDNYEIYFLYQMFDTEFHLVPCAAVVTSFPVDMHDFGARGRQSSHEQGRQDGIGFWSFTLAFLETELSRRCAWIGRSAPEGTSDAANRQLDGNELNDPQEFGLSFGRF